MTISSMGANIRNLPLLATKPDPKIRFGAENEKSTALNAAPQPTPTVSVEAVLYKAPPTLKVMLEQAVQIASKVGASSLTPVHVWQSALALVLKNLDAVADLKVLPKDASAELKASQEIIETLFKNVISQVGKDSFKGVIESELGKITDYAKKLEKPEQAGKNPSQFSPIFTDLMNLTSKLPAENQSVSLVLTGIDSAAAELERSTMGTDATKADTHEFPLDFQEIARSSRTLLSELLKLSKAEQLKKMELHTPEKLDDENLFQFLKKRNTGLAQLHKESLFVAELTGVKTGEPKHFVLGQLRLVQTLLGKMPEFVTMPPDLIPKGDAGFMKPPGLNPNFSPRKARFALDTLIDPSKREDLPVAQLKILVDAAIREVETLIYGKGMPAVQEAGGIGYADASPELKKMLVKLSNARPSQYTNLMRTFLENSSESENKKLADILGHLTGKGLEAAISHAPMARTPEEFLKVLNRKAAHIPAQTQQELLLAIDEQDRASYDDKNKHFQRLDPLLNKQSWEPAKSDVDPEQVRQILKAQFTGMDEEIDQLVDILIANELLLEAGKPPLGVVIGYDGPPGTAKTALPMALGKALNRPVIRISLAGKNDEAHIRGHLFTYRDAEKGAPAKAFLHSGVTNPIIILDEIDKLGEASHGDPAAALLELLDPEQNHSFLDNFLGIPIDLSKVLFIATSNDKTKIPEALRNRIDFTTHPGYDLKTKMEIARNHLIPKARDLYNLAEKQCDIPDETLITLINQYTDGEKGARKLDKMIAKLVSKVAVLARKQVTVSPITVKQLEALLPTGEGARTPAGFPVGDNYK